MTHPAIDASPMVAEVARIAAIRDRVIRNLQITRCYWLLAPLQSINRLLLRKGMFEPGSRLGRAVADIHTPFDAFERASEAVAQGNLKVFDEIGREFARFMATVPADAPPDSDELAALLAQPGRVLSLGRDLEAPVPPVFGGLRHPSLERLVGEFDPCAAGGTACGAQDWSDLRQRMHYIVHLFRAYAEDGSLFSQPFTDRQVAAFSAGVVPDGRL